MKKFAIIIIISVLAIGGAVGAFFVLRKHSTSTSQTTVTTTNTTTGRETRPANSVDYSPATNAPETSSIKSPESTPTPTPSSATAHITITRTTQQAHTIEVRAYIDGISKGTCTARIEITAIIGTAVSEITPDDAGRPTCGQLDVPIQAVTSKTTGKVILEVSDGQGTQTSTTGELEINP